MVSGEVEINAGFPPIAANSFRMSGASLLLELHIEMTVNSLF
jgi:hypothetical protein